MVSIVSGTKVIIIDTIVLWWAKKNANKLIVNVFYK